MNYLINCLIVNLKIKIKNFIMKILISNSEIEGLHPLKKCLPVRLNKFKIFLVVMNKYLIIFRFYSAFSQEWYLH